MDWKAFYLIERAAQDPEITEYDSDEMIEGKLQRTAQLKRKGG